MTRLVFALIVIAFVSANTAITTAQETKRGSQVDEKATLPASRLASTLRKSQLKRGDDQTVEDVDRDSKSRIPLLEAKRKERLGDRDIDELSDLELEQELKQERVKDELRSHDAKDKDLDKSDEKSKTLDEEAVKVFGMKLFEARDVDMNRSILPVGSDYLIGPGDELIVHFWNAEYDSTPLRIEVSRDGLVSLPSSIGAMSVAGLTLDSARSSMLQRVTKLVNDAQLILTLAELRSIPIWLTGYVTTPGLHYVSPLSTIMSALAELGGIRENGSFRRLILRRGDEEPQEIDVYDFLLYGDRKQDVRLKAGDTLFVPPRGPQVQVVGEVKTPAAYELKEVSTLDVVLKMAGGFTGNSYRALVQIERTEGGIRRVVQDIEVGENSRGDVAFEVLDGDLIHIEQVRVDIRNFVDLRGNMERPGRYQWHEGLNLKDLIQRGGRILPDTFMRRGQIRRVLGESRQYRVSADPRMVAQQTQLLHFDLQALQEGDESQNLPLLPMDEVLLFHRDEVLPVPEVMVEGAVRLEGTYELTSGMRVSDLIFIAGGLSSDAYLGQSTIIRRYWENQESGVFGIEKVDIDLNEALNGDPKSDLLLEGFDSLIVRRCQDLTVRTSIEGHVRHPGSYVVKMGARVSDVIDECGGTLERAFLQGVVFTRRSTQDTQQEARDGYVLRQRQQLLTVRARELNRAAGPNERASIEEALAVQESLLDSLAEAEVVGRIPIRGLESVGFRGSIYDLELQDGDEILIPAAPVEIHIVGQVASPGATLFVPGHSLDHYLSMAGGLSEDAERERILIMRANGDRISPYDLNQKTIDWDPDRGMWIDGRVNELKIERGDFILVPPQSRVINGWDTTKDVVDILFKSAVAAGVIVGVF